MVTQPSSTKKKVVDTLQILNVLCSISAKMVTQMGAKSQ
jgi:hypothetical protein